MEGLRKKDRDKKAETATKKYPPDVTPSRRRTPSLNDTNLNKSKQTQVPSTCGNSASGSGYPVGRSFSRSSVLASPSVLIEQSHVSSSANHGPEKLAVDISDYVHDTSVWEAMEIRFLDKGKCTVLRPNLSSVLSSAEASVTSQSSAKNSNPSAVVYPRAHLLNAPLPIRRQKVCVEKVHVRNLLNTKREKCGNLSSSRLSEYMPQLADDANRKKRDGEKRDVSQISKSTSSCASDTDSFDSASDSNVPRSTEVIQRNKRASLKSVNGPDNVGQLTPRSQSTPGLQNCSTMSSRSRDSNEVMHTNKSSCDHFDYRNSLDGMTSQTDKKELYHVNQLKSPSAIGNSTLAYRKCSNFGQVKGSKFDLAETWAKQECSSQLNSTYPQSIRQSPSKCTHVHNLSTDEDHSSADCCISAEKPICQTRRVFAKNPSFGSAESSYEYVSNRPCPSDTHSTPVKRYTGSDKTSDLFTSNISSEAWIKHCTGGFPKDKDEPHENALKGGATKKEASHQSADCDSTELSEQATLSGMSKTKTRNVHPTWAAPNTPSAVDNYSGASLSSAADKTSLAVTPKPKDKGDQSMSMNGAKSSASSFSPLSEAEIARYKEIALEILMQRKKNQRRGAEVKSYRDYSVIPVHRKKRQSSAQLKKVKTTEKQLPTKPASKRPLPDKMEKQRSSSTGRLPRPESVNERTIFWASQRIRNQIEKHKQRLLQTNKAKTKPARGGIHSFTNRKADAKASSTTTSNPSNTDHKDNENPKNRNKTAIKPMLSTVTSETSLTVTSITAVVQRSDTKISMSSLEGMPKLVKEQSLPPGFKNTLATGTTTEWSPGKSDWASSVNLESDNRFAGVKAMTIDGHTDESAGLAVSECKSGDTGPVNSKLMYLDKLDFQDDKLDYAREPPSTTFGSTQKGGKANVSYEHSSYQTTTPRFPKEDDVASGHGSKQSAQPTRYLDLLHNILKSPTSKTTQALSMFLQKPRALAEAERDLDITVDQIISSYQGIFEELRSVPSTQAPSSDRPSIRDSLKKGYTPYESSTLAEDHFHHPVMTCSASSCERFSKVCCTKYDSANLECSHEHVNPADLSYGNESRAEIKRNIASNTTTPQSCKSSKFNVAIVSGRSVSRKFSGASPAPNDLRLGSASLHSALSTPQEHHAPLPRKQSSFSSIKANKPPNSELTNHGFYKPASPSSRKPDVMISNKAESQLSVVKKNNLKTNTPKRPVKVSSHTSSKSNALERSFLERKTPTSKPTIQSLKKKCVSLSTKENFVPTGSKSTTGDYCPKYQRDLAKWALEKENNQFELLLQSFQQNLLTGEHETLAMQHTRPAITIIAPQACLNISSTVMPEVRNKEADSEKSTSTKKSFTDIHLLESLDKRHSMDSFLQSKQGPPVVCKTRRIRTFPLCRREIKQNIPAPLSQNENEVNAKKEQSIEKSIEPPPRKNFLRKENSLSALSVKNAPKGNPRLALQAAAKSRSVRLNSAVTKSEHTIIRAPSSSAALQPKVLVTLTKNASVLKLRKSSSADCAASDGPGIPIKKQGKEDSTASGQPQPEDAQLTKSDTDNYVVQVISSTKSNTNFENGPFDLNKTVAVNTLKIRHNKSVTKAIPRRLTFRKQQLETKATETKLKKDSLKTKSDAKQGQVSSLQQNVKEATKSASASSFNERGKATLIPRRQRASKNQDFVARKKSIPNAKSPRSSSCPPEHKDIPKLQNSSDAKEVSEDLTRETLEKLRTVENNLISTNECDNTRDILESFNSRSGPQKDEDFKKPVLKLDERNFCLKEENEMQTKLPTVTTPNIGHGAVHLEYSSHHEVKVSQTSSAVLQQSEDPQERIEPDIISTGPAEAATVIAPSDTVEHISSQSNVQIVPSSINEFSAFPLIHKRSYDAHVDSRYLTSASEKWPGRSVMSWKQPGSEEDSESEGMSLQAMRRQAVARTCEMIIRESKNSDKNKTDYTGDFAAINKFCNLQRSAETCLGLKTPTKWWPPELLSKTGWLMSSLRTDQEHNLGTKSTLSQDTLDSLAPINAETGEEDEESVDFLKSVSSLKMCCKTQIVKDLLPVGLSKYVDSDSTQEDNVRLITMTDDHSDIYSPALTCDESADKKERIHGILLNDKLAQGEEPKDCFKTRGLPTVKHNQQFNVNLQPKYFPLIETCNEKMDFFSDSPLIQSSFESASYALKINKSDGGADVEDLSSTGANSLQAGLPFPNKFRVDATLGNRTEELCDRGRKNMVSETVASKETISNIGDTVLCFRVDGSVHNSHSQLDKIIGITEAYEEKFAHSVKREIVEMAATVQEETPTGLHTIEDATRLHAIEDAQSPRTKSASDTKKSMTDSFSSALNQEAGALYIDVANSLPFTHESTSLQFESHPLEQTSVEEIQEIITKDIKNKEHLADSEEVKLSEHLLAAETSIHAPERCQSTDDASISSRDYSTVGVNSLCGCLNLLDAVNKPPTSFRDDHSSHGLTTPKDLSLLFPVKMLENLDTAESIVKLSEQEKGNASFEIKVNGDKNFKDGQCQTGTHSEMERDLSSVEFKDPANEQETPKYLTKWTMTSEQESTFDRVTPTFEGERGVSILAESPLLQASVSLSVESEKNVLNEPLVIDDAAYCLHCSRQRPNSLQSYINNDRPCAKDHSLWDNNAGIKAEPYLSNRAYRTHDTRTAERTPTASVNAQEVKMMIRIELSGDNPCKCNKVTEPSPSEDNPSCSFPVIFNPNRENVQELTLHLGPRPMNSSQTHNRLAKTVDHQSSGRFEKHGNFVETSRSKMYYHLELPSSESESRIRTSYIPNESRQSLIPTPHSSTDDKLSAEDFYDTSLTSKAVSDGEEVESFKVDSFRGLPATLYDHENLNVFSETANLYSCASGRESDIDDKSVYVECDRSQRIFYSGVSPERCYRLHHLEGEMHRNISWRETLTSRSKDVSGSTSATYETTPKRGDEKDDTISDDKSIASPAVPPQARKKTPCEAPRHLGETKFQTNAFSEDKQQAQFKSPTRIQFCDEKSDDKEVLSDDLEDLREELPSSEVPLTVNERVGGPEKDVVLCSKECDETTNLKSAEEIKVAVEAKEGSSGIRKLSRIRKINESLIQQKVAENLEMFIKSMRELKLRQSRRSPTYNPNSRSWKNPVLLKQISLPGDTWAGNSTQMSTKVEISKSTSEASKVGLRHALSSYFERSFSRVNVLQSSFKSPPKTEFTPREQGKIYPGSNVLNFTTSSRNQTLSRPTVDCKNDDRTAKSSPTQVHPQATAVPKRETVYVKNKVFQSSVCFVSDASTNTDVSDQVLKEFETNSDSDNTDTFQSAFPRAFNEPRGIDELIAKESPVFNSYLYEHQRIHPTGYCSMLQGFSSQMLEHKAEFVTVKHEKPRINSTNPFLKNMYSNPFIAKNTEQSPAAEPILMNSSRQDYFSFVSQKGRPVGTLSNDCSPLLDLPEAVSPQTQNGSDTFEKPDQFLFTLSDLWLFSSTEKRDDAHSAQNVGNRRRSEQELLVALPVSQCVENTSSPVGAVGNNGHLISPTPKTTCFCRSVGNDGVHVSPVLKSGASYDERDPFEFPPERRDTRLISTGPETNDPTKQVKRLDMFEDTGSWLVEHDNCMKNTFTLYPAQSVEFEKDDEPSDNAKTFKFNNICQQYSGNLKHVHQEPQLIASFSKYKGELKDVSPTLNKSSLCLDDSADDVESSSCLLACSETPLLPREDGAHDIFSSWTSQSSASSPNATRVSSVYGDDDESEIVSTAAHVDLFDGIEVLTYYLMPTYIKVKDKVKRRYLRKNKTKHKRLHKNGIHGSDLFRGMFLPNCVTKKGRVTTARPPKSAPTIPPPKRAAKYNLLKEETHDSCSEGRGVESESSLLSSSTDTSKQYDHRCGKISDPNFPESFDDQLKGSSQEAFPLFMKKVTLSSNMESVSWTALRKTGKLVESERSSDKSPKLAKGSKEKILKHYQYHVEQLRDLSPASNGESREISNDTRYSARFNDDRDEYVKECRSQDDSKNYKKLELMVDDFGKTKELCLKPSSVEALLSGSHCQEFYQDGNVVRCQENNKCPQTSTNSEDPIVDEGFAVKNYSSLEEDREKDAIQPQNKDDNKRSQTFFLAEESVENQFPVGEISPCIEEDEGNDEITFQVDNKTSQTNSNLEESFESRSDFGKESKCIVEEETKIEILLQSDNEKKSSQANVFQVEESPENKFDIGQLSPITMEDESRKGITVKSQNHINTAPKISHLEELFENTFHVAKKSGQFENSSAQTMSHTETADDKRDDFGRNYKCMEEDCEINAKQRRSRFDDKHCQTILHIEEFNAIHENDVGEISKCLNEVPDKSAIICASDDEIECSRSTAKSKPAGKEVDASPNCKRHAEEGKNEYLCCGQNNNKKLQNVFHKAGKLADSQTDAARDVECLEEYQWSAQSHCLGDDNNINSKTIWPHNYSCCSAGHNFYTKLVSVDRALSPIAFENSDAKIDKPSDDIEPTEPNDAEMPFNDGSGFIFCGSPQQPCMGPLNYLQALFLMLGSAEPYPFAPNPDFFDVKEAMPDSLESELDVQEKDVSSLVERESSDGLKIWTKGYCALQRDNKLDKNPALVASRDNLQQEISATQTSSGFLGETHGVVYPTKMFEQDYDGEIHEVVFFTKDLIGDTAADTEKMQEPTVWCKEDGCCATEKKSSQEIINVDDNLPLCCHKMVPKQELQLSPPKRRRTYPAAKFGKLTSGSPSLQRRGESSDRSKDKCHTSGTGASYFRSFRENCGSRKLNLKPFSRKQMRLNRLLYTDGMDQKCSPQCPSNSAEFFVQPSDDKIKEDNYAEKKEAETPRPATANVCNRTYSCQGHEEWVYHKNAPIDSTLLSEMQTEFNEKEGSVEALDRKVVVQSDSPFFFDDYELDTYEELGSLFTEMQESSSSVLLQDEVGQDEEKCHSHFCETLSDNSASTKVSEPHCSFHGQRKEPNTYCTTCAATQTFLSVHHYLSEVTSSSSDQVSGDLPRSNNTQRIDQVSPTSRERLHVETNCVVASSSKHKNTDNSEKFVPILTSCFTQTEPQAMTTDISVANSETPKYVYFRNVLHKCMQSQSFLKYVQKIVDESIGKKSTNEKIQGEAAITPNSVPIAPKPKPRSVLGHQCGQIGQVEDQQTLLTGDIKENRASLTPPPAVRGEKLRDVSVDESSSKDDSCFVRMQSSEDDLTEKSSEDLGECRPVTCNTMSRRKMLSLRRLRRNKDTFVTKKFLSESEAHPISSSSLIIMWSDSTERPTLENNKDETEIVSVASMTSASCCNNQNFECSIPSSSPSLTAPIGFPCEWKATVCDKACSVVNIASSEVGSPFKESQASLSKRKPKKGNAENSKLCLSEPNIKFECEEESAFSKRLETPLAEVKTSESTGTLTTTSIDYGRLKNILSAETKKLWKSLTRLEKNSEKCHVCRLQYNSLLTNSTDRVDFANLEDENVAHAFHVHDAFKAWEVEYLKMQHTDSCRAEASVYSKTDCIEDASKETTSLTNNPQKANTPGESANLEDSSVITRNHEAESMTDTAPADLEELKEVSFSTIEKPLKKTSFCAGVTKPDTAPEEHNYRDVQINLNLGPNRIPTPIQMEHQDDRYSDSHANIRQNIATGKNNDRRSGHSLTESTRNVQGYKQHQEVCIKNGQVSTQCQTDSESTHSCSPLVVKEASQSLGASYQKLQLNRKDNTDKVDAKPHAKSSTDSTSHTQSDTADYWIERLMNILHEMHQTFPNTATSSSVSSNRTSKKPSLLGKTETQQCRGCPSSQEKKVSLADNTSSHNVCGLNERNSVTENSEGKSNPSSHYHVPSQSSATLSPKMPNEVPSLKESTFSHHESYKQSVSFSQSNSPKKPSFPDSSFLNVNSTGVVSEPLDLQRLQSLTSMTSDCHGWDQVKFTTSRENQKQTVNGQPSFLRHSNNHNYFSSSTLHYKKYQLRKSGSVPDLGHISHLNKSFNAPLFLDNDAGNQGSIRFVEVIRERNTSSSLIRKTKSETHKEYPIHQQNCSEINLSKKHFKPSEEHGNVITVASREAGVYASTQASEPAKTSSQSITHLLLNSDQESSKGVGSSSHINEFRTESERYKMSGFASDHDQASEQSNKADRVSLSTRQGRRQSNAGNVAESTAKVPQSREASVSVRDFVLDHQKEAAVNVIVQAEGKRKPFRETRHKRATSGRANAKMGKSCSSVKSFDEGGVFRDPRKTASLKDGEKTDEAQGNAEHCKSVTANSRASLAGASTVVGNCSQDLATTAHHETSADLDLDRGESARACDTLMNNKNGERVFVQKIDNKAESKTISRHAREAPDSSLYLKSRALLRRSQGKVEGDLKMINSQGSGTIDKNSSFLCQDSKGDQDICVSKRDDVPRNGAPYKNTERYPRPGAAALQNSSAPEFGITPREIEPTLKVKDGDVGVENCVIEEEAQKCCDDLTVRRDNLACNDVPVEANKPDLNDIENEVNQFLRNDIHNETNQLIRKECQGEVSLLIRKDCPNEVSQLIRKDCPDEVNQSNGNDCRKDVNQLIRKDCPDEVNQSNGKDCREEVNQLIRNDCPDEVSQLIRKDFSDEFNQPNGKDCREEVNQLIRKDCSDEVNQSNGKDCQYEVNQHISYENGVKRLICSNDVMNEVNQSICTYASNVSNEGLCNDVINEMTQSFCKDVKRVSDEDILHAANDDTYQPLCSDGQREVQEFMRSNVNSDLSRRKCNGGENEASQSDGNEVLIMPRKDFLTEGNCNIRAAVSVKVKDNTKFASNDAAKKESPRAQAANHVRPGHFLSNETPRVPEVIVDDNGSHFEDTRLNETEVANVGKAVSFSRILHPISDLQGEGDRELKTFVQREKKNLPIWKHWREDYVNVSAEENEVKRSAVFKNQDGIGSNFFIQNDKKARMSKYYPDVGPEMLASCVSPGKTRRLAAMGEKPESGAVLLRTPNCEVTAHQSPGIAFKSEGSVSSAGPSHQSSKSPLTRDQPILFNDRLKPVGACGVLWAERRSLCGSSPPTPCVCPDAPEKQTSSDLAGTATTLLGLAGASVDETGYDRASAARESPDNQGACLVEEPSDTTVDHLYRKYNLFPERQHPRSPHSEPKSQNSEAEIAPSVLRSPYVLPGHLEGEEDYAYGEEGYIQSEANSTLERFDPLSWEVPESAEGASMKSDPFYREDGNESNKRGATCLGLHALEIPVDIYTLPVRPTKKDAASHKKKKKKKENSFTRTVVISGPLSNFSIPVHRHVSQSEDANQAREDDLSSKKAACSKSITASHKSLSCRTKTSLPVDSPQRWMSSLRNFLPFRKKSSEKHKQMIPK